MSYLNPAQEWEELCARDPFLATLIVTAPRALFMPPPGVDAGRAYTRAFCALAAICLVAGTLWMAT